MPDGSKAPGQNGGERAEVEFASWAGRASVPSAEGDEALARRRVEADPNDPAAAIELALLLLRKGELSEGEGHARNAVRLAPTSAQSHHVLAMLLTEAHRPHAGEYHYLRALELSEQRDPVLVANLAWNLRNQGRMDEARKLYQEVVASGPPVAQTLLGFARLEEADRRFEHARRILDEAQARFPDDPHLMFTRAVLLGRTGEPERGLAVLGRLEAMGPAGLGPEAWAERGALLDRLGRYDEAFAAFSEGKRRVRALTGDAYAADTAQDLARRLQRFFTARRRRILPRATVAAGSAQPIFILGFPRSGTTLVEQILSSHPQIAAGDELPLLDELSNLTQRLFSSPLPYPEALAELWMAEHHDGADVLRDHYLRRARQ
ncbi:MAG: tetratricopeptide repeat protein, partial [Acetobacteraceae bacterium]|nr:tetratricopeptide repeat protein [Acetobacteraceae bacterium]